MPIDRGIVDQQLLALGEGSRWWNERELRDLPAVLNPDEHVLAIARGKLTRLRWLRRSWLIVVTEKRLLCLRSAGQTGWRQFEVAAGQISRVALRVGPFRGRVLVVTGGHNYRLLVPRADSYRVMDALSALCRPGADATATFTTTRMIRRVMDHVLALPAVALRPEGQPLRPVIAPVQAAETAEMEERCQTLEEEVQELRRQVDFLEQLLHDRNPDSAPL